MVSFLSTTKLNNFLLCTTLVTFSLTSIVAPVYAQNNFLPHAATQINDAALMLRLQKIVNRLMKLEKSSKVGEMIDLMLDARQEVQAHTGVYIPLEINLNQIKADMQTKGYKVSSKEFENFKKLIKKKEKQHKQHAHCVQMALESGIDFDEENILALFMGKHGKDDKHDEASVPIRVAFGVTVALCGFFLYCLPLPPAKVWGARLMEAGLMIAVEGGISHKEKEENKDKDD